jgi:hypothetical protein
MWHGHLARELFGHGLEARVTPSAVKFRDLIVMPSSATVLFLPAEVDVLRLTVPQHRADLAGLRIANNHQESNRLIAEGRSRAVGPRDPEHPLLPIVLHLNAG